MLKDAEYIIIGQGISGTVLSMQFTEKNIPHLVVDQPGLSQSSAIAAGLINPVVLKRLKLVYNAEEYLQYAKPFYLKWEGVLQTHFFHELAVFHLFSSAGEQNHWLEKSENPMFKSFLGDIDTSRIKNVKSPYGFGKMSGTARLNTIGMINSYRIFLQEKGQYQQAVIDEKSLSEIAVNKKVILANGYLMREILPSVSDYFSPTRGEVMIIESEELPKDKILHSGVFTMPLGNNHFKIGATYHWEKLQDITTPEGLNKLKNELIKFYKGRYTVKKHMGGVRPNVKDRKPLLGKVGSNLYSFNGMGSRAALMAPFLSEIIANYLLNNMDIPPEYDINRFTSN